MNSPQKLSLPWREPVSVAHLLAHKYGETGMIWLDGDGSDLGRYITLDTAPVETISSRGLPGEPDACNPFELLKQLEPGHWTGWLSYEAAAWNEPRNPWKPNAMASLWIARHDPVLRFDLKKKDLWVEGLNQQRLRTLAYWLEGSEETINDQDRLIKTRIPISSWYQHTDKIGFVRGVQSIRELIASGDLFQANLSVCYSRNWPKGRSPLELFLKIRQQCLAPFSGLIVTGDSEAILSYSPERFLKVNTKGQVEARPIKGTRPRSDEPLIDADLAAELVCSEKDRAENIMIVDLLRNDLGRVCEPGSIKVPQIVGLESYRSVHHLTSVVEGQLRQNLSWVDLLRACWPGGSVTGAPKLRACQRLHELEPTSRGPYCGSLIKVDWEGCFDSNILIRSLMRQGDKLRVHAGCGIVADSEPEVEAEELKWKIQPLLKALQ